MSVSSHCADSMDLDSEIQPDGDLIGARSVQGSDRGRSQQRRERLDDGDPHDSTRRRIGDRSETSRSTNGSRASARRFSLTDGSAVNAAPE